MLASFSAHTFSPEAPSKPKHYLIETANTQVDHKGQDDSGVAGNDQDDHSGDDYLFGCWGCGYGYGYRYRG